MRHTKGWAVCAALLFFGSYIGANGQAAFVMKPGDLANKYTQTTTRPPEGKNVESDKKAPPGGFDSIPYFEGSFETAGYGPTGAPQNKWYYSMAGQSPNEGETTRFRSPVIPVSIELLAADGTQGYYNGQPLYYDATQYVSAFVKSPVYRNSRYSSSQDPTQITDAIMRAEFLGRNGSDNGNGNQGGWRNWQGGGNQQQGGGQQQGDSGNWHTLLSPAVRDNYVMKIPYGYYYFAPNTDGSCCSFILVDYNTFGNLLIPPTTPDSTTAVGNAEITGEITTKDISTFLFPNTYLYFGTPGNCCVLGFHTYDNEAGTPQNGNLPRRYVLNYSSWISPGIFAGGIQDVTALSHEMAETFNDPFVASDGIHNITPWWLSPNGNCQDNLEVGDVIEGLPNDTYPVTIDGFAYHPQNEALLSWFEFQSPSQAIDQAYSYPDESTLTALSPVEPLNCQ